MPFEHDIKFSTTPSKTRLTGSKVRYQGQLHHNQVLSEEETRRRFAQYMCDTTARTNYFLDGLGSFVAEQAALGYRLDFGPFAVGLKIRGSFPAANAPFDATANSIAVEMMPAKPIKAATASLKPINVTIDDRCCIYNNLQTSPYKAMDEIALEGTRTLITTGRHILVNSTSEGEGVWIENDLGEKLLTGTVTEADNSRLATTFTGPIAPGLHWLMVMSRHSQSGELLTARRRITAR